MKSLKIALIVTAILIFSVVSMNAFVWRPDDSVNQLAIDGQYVGGSNLIFVYLNTTEDPPSKVLTIAGSNVEFITGEPGSWHPTDGNWIGVKIDWPYEDEAITDRLNVGSTISYNVSGSGYVTKSLTAAEVSDKAFYFFFNAADYLTKRAINIPLQINWLNDLGTTDDELITIGLEDLILDLGDPGHVVRDNSKTISQDADNTGDGSIVITPTYNDNDTTQVQVSGEAAWYFDGETPNSDNPDGNGNWIGMNIEWPFKSDGSTDFTFTAGDVINVYYDDPLGDFTSYTLDSDNITNKDLDIFCNAQDGVSTLYIDWDSRYQKEKFELDKTGLTFEDPSFSNFVLNDTDSGNSNTYIIGDVISGSIDLEGTDTATVDLTDFGGPSDLDLVQSTKAAQTFDFSYTIESGNTDITTGNITITAADFENDEVTYDYNSDTGNSISIDNQYPNVTDWGSFDISVNDDLNTFADFNNGSADEITYSGLAESTGDGITWTVDTAGELPTLTDGNTSETVTEGDLDCDALTGSEWDPEITVADDAGNEVTGNSTNLINFDNNPPNHTEFTDYYLEINPSKNGRDLSLDVDDVIRVVIENNGQGIESGEFDFSSINPSFSSVPAQFDGNLIYADYTIQYGDNQVNDFAAGVELVDLAGNNDSFTVNQTQSSELVDINPTPGVTINYFRNIDSASNNTDFLKAGQEAETEFEIFDDTNVDNVVVELNTDANGSAAEFSETINSGFKKGLNTFGFTGVNSKSLVADGDPIVCTITINYASTSENDQSSITADDSGPVISNINFNAAKLSQIQEGTTYTATADITDPAGVDASSLDLTCSDGTITATFDSFTAGTATWTDIVIPADFSTNSIEFTFSAADDVSNITNEIEEADVYPIPTITNVEILNNTQGISDFFKNGDDLNVEVTVTDLERIDELTLDLPGETQQTIADASISGNILTYSFTDVNSSNPSITATAEGTTQYDSGDEVYSLTDDINVDNDAPVINDITHNQKIDVTEGTADISADITETGSGFELADLILTAGSNTYIADSYSAGIATWEDVTIPEDVLSIDLSVDATDRVGLNDTYEETWEIGPVPEITDVSLENLSAAINTHIKQGDDLKVIATLENYERIDEIEFSLDEISETFIVSGPFLSSTLEHTFNNVNVTNENGNLTVTVTGTSNYTVVETYSNNALIEIDNVDPSVSNLRVETKDSIEENTTYTFKANIQDSGSGVNTNLSTMILSSDVLTSDFNADSYSTTTGIAVWEITLPADIDLSIGTFTAQAEDNLGQIGTDENSWDIYPIPTIINLTGENVNFPAVNYIKNGDDLKVTAELTDSERVDNLTLSLSSDGSQNYTFNSSEIGANVEHTFNNVIESDNIVTITFEGTTNYDTPLNYSETLDFNVDNTAPTIENITITPNDDPLSEGSSYTVSADITDLEAGLNETSIALNCTQLGLSAVNYDTSAGNTYTWNNVLNVPSISDYAEYVIEITAEDNLENQAAEDINRQVGLLPQISSVDIENLSVTNNNFMKDGDDLKVIANLDDHQKIDSLEVWLSDGTTYKETFSKAEINNSTFEVTFNNVIPDTDPLIASVKIITELVDADEVSTETASIAVDNSLPVVGNIVFLSKQTIEEGETYSVQVDITDTGSGINENYLKLNCPELTLDEIQADSFDGTTAVWNDVITVPDELDANSLNVEVVAQDLAGNEGSNTKVWDINPAPTITSVEIENNTLGIDDYIKDGDELLVRISLTDYERVDQINIDINADTPISEVIPRSQITSNTFEWTTILDEEDDNGVLKASVIITTNYFNSIETDEADDNINIDNLAPVIQNISHDMKYDIEEGLIDITAEIVEDGSGIVDLSDIILNGGEETDRPADTFTDGIATWENVNVPDAQYNVEYQISAVDKVNLTGTNSVTWEIGPLPEITSASLINKTVDNSEEFVKDGDNVRLGLGLNNIERIDSLKIQFNDVDNTFQKYTNITSNSIIFDNDNVEVTEEYLIATITGYTYYSDSDETFTYELSDSLLVDNELPVINDIYALPGSAKSRAQSDLVVGEVFTVKANITDLPSGIAPTDVYLTCDELSGIEDVPGVYDVSTDIVTWENILDIPEDFTGTEITADIQIFDKTYNETNGSKTWTLGQQPGIDYVLVRNTTDSNEDYMNDQDDLKVIVHLFNYEEIDEVTISLDSDNSPNHTFSEINSNTLEYTFENVVETNESGELTALVQAVRNYPEQDKIYENSDAIGIDNQLPVISNISYNIEGSKHESDMVLGNTYSVTAEITDVLSGLDVSTLRLSCEELELTNEIGSYDVSSDMVTWNNIIELNEDFTESEINVEVSAIDKVQNSNSEEVTWTIGQTPAVNYVFVNNISDDNPNYMNNEDDLEVVFELENLNELDKVRVQLENTTSDIIELTELSSVMTVNFSEVTVNPGDTLVIAKVEAIREYPDTDDIYFGEDSIIADNFGPEISNITHNIAGRTISDIIENVPYDISAKVIDNSSGLDLEKIILTCNQTGYTQYHDIYEPSNDLNFTWNDFEVSSDLNLDEVTVDVLAYDIVGNYTTESITWSVGDTPAFSEIFVENTTDENNDYMNNGDDIRVAFNIENYEELEQVKISLNNDSAMEVTFDNVTETIVHTFEAVPETDQNGTLTATITGTLLDGGSFDITQTGSIEIDNQVPEIGEINYIGIEKIDEDLVQGITYSVTAEISDELSGLVASSLTLTCDELEITDEIGNWDVTNDLVTWNSSLEIPEDFDESEINVLIKANDNVMNANDKTVTWTVGGQPVITEVIADNITDNNVEYLNNGDDIQVAISIANHEELDELTIGITDDDSTVYEVENITGTIIHTFENVQLSAETGDFIVEVIGTSIYQNAEYTYTNSDQMIIDNQLPSIENISYLGLGKEDEDLVQGISYTVTANVSDELSGLITNSITLSCTELGIENEQGIYDVTNDLVTWNEILEIPEDYSGDDITVSIYAQDNVMNENTEDAVWTVGGEPNITAVIMTNSTDDNEDYMNDGDDLTVDFTLENWEELDELTIELDSENSPTHDFTAPFSEEMSFTFENVVETSETGTITAVVTGISNYENESYEYQNSAEIDIDNVIPVVQNIEYVALGRKLSRESDLEQGIDYSVTAEINDDLSGIDQSSIRLSCPDLSIVNQLADSYDGNVATWNSILQIPESFNPEEITVSVEAADNVENENSDEITWSVGGQPDIVDAEMTNITDDLTDYMNSGDDINVDVQLDNWDELDELTVTLDSDDVPTYSFEQPFTENMTAEFTNVTVSEDTGTLKATVIGKKYYEETDHSYEFETTIAIDNVIPEVGIINYIGIGSNSKGIKTRADEDLVQGITYTVTAEVSDVDSGIDKILLDCPELGLSAITPDEYDGALATWESVLAIPNDFTESEINVEISADDMVQNTNSNEITWSVGGQPEITSVLINNTTENTTEFMKNEDNLEITIDLANWEEIDQLTVALDSDETPSFEFTAPFDETLTHTFENVIAEAGSGTITATVTAISTYQNENLEYQLTDAIEIDNTNPVISETEFTIGSGTVTLTAKVVDEGIGIDLEDITVDLSNFEGETARTPDSYENETAVWILDWESELNSNPIDELVTISAADNFNNGPATSDLTIEATPLVDVSEESFEFEEIYVGHISQTQSFTITNESYAVLEVSNLAAPAEYQVVESGSNEWAPQIDAFNLMPLESIDIQVRYAPNTTGNHEGDIVINTNDPLNEEILIALTSQTEEESEELKPNAFTPNGDGINDDYRIGPFEDFLPTSNKTAKLEVYNIRGKLVVERSGPADREILWNGIKDSNNKLVQGNIYIYRYLVDGKEYRKGKIYIIK